MVKSKAKVGANAAKAVVVPTPKAAVAETETANVLDAQTKSSDAAPVFEAEKIQQQQQSSAVASSSSSAASATSANSSASSSTSSSSTSCVTGLLAALMITLLVVFALCLVFPPMRVETERALAVAQGAVVRHSAAVAATAAQWSAQLQTGATTAYESARQYVNAALNLQ